MQRAQFGLGALLVAVGACCLCVWALWRHGDFLADNSFLIAMSGSAFLLVRGWKSPDKGRRHTLYAWGWALGIPMLVLIELASGFSTRVLGLVPFPGPPGPMAQNMISWGLLFCGALASLHAAIGLYHGKPADKAFSGTAILAVAICIAGLRVMR